MFEFPWTFFLFTGLNFLRKGDLDRYPLLQEMQA